MLALLFTITESDSDAEADMSPHTADSMEHNIIEKVLEMTTISNTGQSAAVSQGISSINVKETK